MNKREKAITYKHNGCNCCQAVLMAYEEELEHSEEMLKTLGAPFGAGMGGMEATCGALCGAQMVLSLKNQQGPVLPKARKLLQAFEQKSGATICHELKGRETGKELCSCDDCVGNAVDALEEMENV